MKRLQGVSLQRQHSPSRLGRIAIVREVVSAKSRMPHRLSATTDEEGRAQKPRGPLPLPMVLTYQTEARPSTGSPVMVLPAWM